MQVLVLALLLLLVLFVATINLNHKIAYLFYRTPIIHHAVKLFCKRNVSYLKSSTFVIPNAIHPAIDDLGWTEGKDLRKKGGPSRLILDRKVTLEDYENLVEISEKSGCRLVGLFVLGDYDKENICADKKYNRPEREFDLTEYGTTWNNKKNISDGNTKVLNYIKDHSSNVEFGLHGIRHEQFKEGYINAEWADRFTGKSWGAENTKIHCEVFQKILRQYFAEEICDFPQIFVPPAHAFDMNDKESIEVLKDYGIKYMCSSCSGQPSMKEIVNSGKYKDGILMLDRTEVCVPEKTSYAPKNTNFVNSMIGTHFPNFFNGKKKWVRFFKKVDQDLTTVVGKNSEYTYSQWIYNHSAVVTNKNGKVYINALNVPGWAYENGYVQGIVLKMHLHNNHISEFISDNLVVLDYYEDDNENAYLTIGDPKIDNTAIGREIYNFTYKLGDSKLTKPHFIRRKQTYNVLSLTYDESSVNTTIKIYGKHKICIYTGFSDNMLELHTEGAKIYNSVSKDGICSFEIDCEEMLGKTVKFTIKNIKEHEKKDV